MPPIKFLLKIIYGFEEVVWKFQEGCLVQDYLLYLSGMKEAFLSLFLAWPIQSSFCSWGSMVWRKMFSVEYQDCCLVIGYFWYLNKTILYILSLNDAWYLLKRTLWFWRNSFEEFQDGCLVHSHLWYLNEMISAIQGLCFTLMPPIKFSLKRINGLEENIVWSTEDSCHGGTTQWFRQLWVYNPQSNALQTQPLHSTNMQMVSWVLISSEQLPYHTQSL